MTLVSIAAEARRNYRRDRELQRLPDIVQIEDVDILVHHHAPLAIVHMCAESSKQYMPAVSFVLQPDLHEGIQ